MRRFLGRLLPSAVLVTALLTASAWAAVTVYEGKGVGKSRLGWNDHKAATAISSKHFVKKDTSYDYVVYHWYVGRRLSNRRYPVELYAKKDHRVYRFHINSAGYVTSAGVKVGSTVQQLQDAYTNETGPRTSGTYRVFRIKHASSTTEFYCKDGKVNFIVIRR